MLDSAGRIGDRRVDRATVKVGTGGVDYDFWIQVEALVDSSDVFGHVTDDLKIDFGQPQ
jgi:hypothetical protein